MKKANIFFALIIFSGFTLFAQNHQELHPGAAPVSGTLQAGAEFWYSARAVSNGILIIETSGNTDTFLEAYDAQNNLIAENDDGGENTNARIEMIVRAGSTYLIKLRGYGSHNSGPYHIWARAEPLPAAVELRFGEERQVNLSAGARNWYSVSAAAAGYVIVETSGDAIDPFMYLYDSQYNLITHDDDGGNGLNSRIEILAQPNQTYFFVVRAYNADEAGPYGILASYEPISEDTERNTERERAVTVKLGEAIPVFFRETNESRWYRYEATRPGTIFVVQTRGNLDTTLLLYDSRGNLIAEDSYSGEYPNGLIYERLNPGTYYIEVVTYTNGAGGIGRCTLHAETR